MTEFYFEGYLQGKKIKGIQKAKDKHQLLTILREQGITPVKIDEKKDSRLSINLFTKKPSEEDVAFVLMQIHTLLKSGLTLTKALDLLSSQVEDERISQALLNIKSDIENGKSIPVAFASSKIFPEFLSSMLSSAQTGENLEMIFHIVADYMFTVSELKSRIFSALIYPSVIIVFSFVSVLIATKFVVPKIASVLIGFGKDLPLITKAVLVFSKVFTIFTFLIPVFVILFTIKDKFVNRISYDRFLLKLPVIGKVILYFNLSRFARILSMTLSASTPIQTAITMAAGSISNSYLRNKIEQVKDEIVKGKSISATLSKTGVFPPLFINLLKTGEESSRLEEMLLTVQDIYTRQLNRTIDRWVKLIEPATMLIIGVIIAIIVISVILPITELSTGVKR